METVLVILLFAGLITCEDQTGVDFLDSKIQISIKSKNDGSDLLNPTNANSFNESEIKIYHFVDGKFKEVNRPRADYPKDFFIFESNTDTGYWIRIFGFTENGIKESTTLVEWNDTDTDTLKYTIDRKNNGAYASISKVWFNDAEVWDRQTGNDERHFEIVK